MFVGGARRAAKDLIDKDETRDNRSVTVGTIEALCVEFEAMDKTCISFHQIPTRSTQSSTHLADCWFFDLKAGRN